jgi:hypothetical protein
MDDKGNALRAGMHGGCKCDRKHWRVCTRHGNRSAFNGYHLTWSAWSQLRCLFCGHFWRSKAKYVASIPDARGDEARRSI